MLRVKVLITLFFLLLVPVAYAQEEHQHQGTAEQLGRVSFPTSCQPAGARQFERGLAMLHSFWYEEAEKAFQAATAADPGCTMGYWGQAMSHYHPLWEPPKPAELQAGWAAVEAARAANPKTQRERDYIAAIEIFYKDAAQSDHRTRALAYRAAMQKLYERYPEDREAAVFYALSLLATASPADKSFANQIQAGKILETVFAEQPQHPGVSHYLIHAYDYPALASRALPWARAYAKIAPSVPHALHMPSHIFTRLGLWEESIASNRASAQAAHEYAIRTKMNATWDQELHAMDYLEYAYLQRGQYAEAKKIVDQEEAIQRVEPDSLAAAYARAAIPARYALERRAWREAATLTAKPGRYPASEAITYLAQAIGAARSGQVAAAREAGSKLQAIHSNLVSAGQTYWAEQVRIQELAATAWLAKAEGRKEDAIRTMTEAAQVEDSTDKHPVTPGSVVPARELLGELYLELNQPAEASREFAATLKDSPNRAMALYGAARAAELQGDRAAAKRLYQTFLELQGGSNAQSAEIQSARAFVEKN